MVKRILAVVIALVAALGLVMAFEYIGGFLFQYPDADMKNPTTISDRMAGMPIAAFLWILLGYAVSSFIGGLIASLISGHGKVQPALIVGAMLMVGGIMNLIMVPHHPMWFVIANVFAYVPFAWFGYLMARAKRKEKEKGHIPSSPSK